MAAAGDEATLLIVEDEAPLLALLADHLRDAGLHVVTAEDGEAAWDVLQRQPVGALLLDLHMPRLDGLALLERLGQLRRIPPTVVMSAHASLDTALAAMRLGASDWVSKPFRLAEVELKVRLALARQRPATGEQPPRPTWPTTAPSRADGKLFYGMVAQSAAMLQLFRQIERVARFGSTVLISGESGSGKELVARALHLASPRARQPFVAVNCGAIPENLLESELFGHVRGAFTDATADRRGLFEEAHGGTLLLDEIVDLPLHLQVKLLRVLQEGEIRRVGSNKPTSVDVRVVAASAVPVRERVAQGRFREDLFYRLSVIELAVPPLRARPDDLPLLVNHLIERTNQRLGTQIRAVDAAALALLRSRPWPGNVRELHNVIEQACVLAEGPVLTASLLQPFGSTAGGDQDGQPLATPNLSIPQAVEQTERALIEQALRQTDGNRLRAAELLDISPRNLHYKIKLYGIGVSARSGRPRQATAAAGEASRR